MTASPPTVLLLGDTLGVGGTERQFVELACRLNRARWNLRVACLRAEGPLRARLEASGVSAWSCGPGSFRSPRFATAVVRLARAFRSGGVRLVHSFDFYSNLLGVLAARLARVPAVIASQRDLGDLRPRMQQRIHGLVLQLATHVLVNTQAVAERLTRAGTVPAQRLTVIPNGVDLDRFTPPGDGHRAGAVRIGTLANLRPEKRIEDLVRAAAEVRQRVPDARFLVWGDGPLRSHLDRLVGQLGLTGTLELCGATPEPERALAGMEIYVLSSVSEACSNVLLEAMATGCAVIATRVGGNPAMVEDGVTGLLVPPGDPTAIAAAIIHLIENPELAAGLAARGRDRVRAAFGIEAMVARVEALYEHALGASGTSGNVEYRTSNIE